MTYVVGDVHGMYENLLKLLDKLPLGKTDEIVFLGDYIDRGPNSKGVVDLLIDLSKYHNTVFIRGNHEDMMLKCLKLGDCLTWHFNGADATLRSFGGVERMKKYLDFFESLKIFHEKGIFLMVHGGVKPGIPLKDQDEFDMLWIRDEFIYSVEPLPGRVVVFGHTPMDRPLISNDKIGIDTGCVYGGHLTSVRLEDLEIFQVPCH